MQTVVQWTWDLGRAVADSSTLKSLRTIGNRVEQESARTKIRTMYCVVQIAKLTPEVPKDDQTISIGILAFDTRVDSRHR